MGGGKYRETKMLAEANKHTGCVLYMCMFVADITFILCRSTCVVCTSQCNKQKLDTREIEEDEARRGDNQRGKDDGDEEKIGFGLRITNSKH